MIKLIRGVNDLATVCPELAAEWHPTKNGELKPTDVIAGSTIKVWWLLPYDDSKTGKHFDFEWKASVVNRKKGKGCPYLSGRSVWRGFNDLQTLYPQLATEWHPTKNGNLKPSDVTVGTTRKVWWYLPYVDPKTDKHFNFEWESVISDRANGIGCPYLSGRAVWQGFNDLQTLYPQLAAEWHPTKNGNLKPIYVTANSNKKVWWYLPYDDPKTGKHFNFEWDAVISNRLKGVNCPYLSNKAIWYGFNDLETYCKNNHFEYILDEWDYTKNKKITPKNITYGSNKSVYWICPNNHKYKMKITARTRVNHNCPICAKEKMTSFAEQTIFYYIKKYFKDAINGDTIILNGKELDIYIPSKKIAIEYDGETFHKNLQRDLIKNQLCHDNKILLIRIRETNCPNICEDEFVKIIDCIAYNEQSLKQSIIKLGEYIGIQFDVDISRDRGEIYSQYIHSMKENSLASKFPEMAKEWHPTKNGDLKPTDVTASSTKKVWWYLPYDDPKTGKHFDFEWETAIYSRTSSGGGCPYLAKANARVFVGFNDLATTHPELAAEWHPTKNGDLKPIDVTFGSQKKVWWLLPYDDPKTGEHFDFEWKASIAHRVYGCRCPYLLGQAVWARFNDLQTIHPEIAKQWHPTKNGDLKPTDVTANSGKKVWWMCPICGYEWYSEIYKRKECKKCK